MHGHLDRCQISARQVAVSVCCRWVLWLTRRVRNQVNFPFTRHHRRKFLDSKVLGYGHAWSSTNIAERSDGGCRFSMVSHARQPPWHAQSTPPSFLLPLRDYSQLRPADPPLAFSPSNNFDPRLSSQPYPTHTFWVPPPMWLQPLSLITFGSVYTPQKYKGKS